MQTQLTLTEGMAFEVELDGHRFMVDAHAASGGKDRGPAPKSLLLPALAGCTGMDVISILRKMRAEPATFSVSVESELTDEHPKILKDVVVSFRLTGPDLDAAKVWKAVGLSRDRYCGVSAMLKATANIEMRVYLNDVLTPEPA